MKRFCMCLLGAASLVMPSQAQTLKDRQTVIPITLDSLQAMLDEAGWPNQQTKTAGEDIIVAKFDGKTIVLWPQACSDLGVCSGLLSFASLGDTANTAQVNQFNNRHHAARASLRNGHVILDSYTYADFGVVRGSLLIELAVLAKLVDDWWIYDRQMAEARSTFQPIQQVAYTDENGAEDFPFSSAALVEFANVSDAYATGSSQPHLSSTRPSNKPKN